MKTASPALIFDLDGTLVDTAPDLLAATNAVLSAQARRPIDPASLRHMVGHGGQWLIAQAMAATGAPVAQSDLAPLMAIFLDHYRAHIADLSRPFGGVEETLAALTARGARLGVLTNKPQDLAELLLERLGMAQYFTAIYGNGRKSYTKPDPRIFHEVVTDCGGGPAAMIGDSITDLQTARAADVPCVLFAYGYTPVPAIDLGADAVLEDFRELPNALKTLDIL